jgi:hypothetical protein
MEELYAIKRTTSEEYFYGYRDEYKWTPSINEARLFNDKEEIKEMLRNNDSFAGQTVVIVELIHVEY